MEAPKKIVWSKRSLMQFEKNYLFIKEDTEQNAENVRTAILKNISKAAIYPESFSLEKYKRNNDGSYQYFEKFHLQIFYRVVHEAI